METARNRTLVVHTGGIGDFLLFGPALQRLCELGPVELAGRTERLKLAKAAGLVDAVHGLDAIQFESVFGEPSEVLRKFVGRFDRVVVWMRDDDRAIRQGIRSCGVDAVDAWPGLPPDGWTRHASAYYLDCLGMPVPDGPFRLRPTPEPIGLDVVIHPGSGGARKNWPVERFLAVAARLRASGRDVVWSMGPADEGVGVPEDEPRLQERPLVELARCLAGARLYLGNDSGITHLAAAVGCPTVAVFGTTDPIVWAPRGEHVRVVRGEPWPDIQEVGQAADSFPNCR